jgi:hypothetical protein
VAAFEAARTLDPDDHGRERALAALYLKVGPSVSDRAVAAHQALAAHAPDEAEPYQVLERLWSAEHAPEKAAWASAVLAQLGHASEGPAGSGPLRWARATLVRRMSEPLWECLYHPDEDRVLSTLFSVLAPSLVAQVAEPLHLFPPRRSEAVPPVDPSATRPSRAAAGLGANAFVSAALAHVSHLLEVAPPALFLVYAPARPATVRLRAGWPGVRPALLVDRRFAGAAPEEDVLFELARLVALLRSPWLLRFAARAPELLERGLCAARALGGLEEPAGAGTRAVRGLLAHLREERPDLAQEQVAALASELAHRPQPPELDRWQAGVELSAARAALSITGDLEAALRCLRADGTRPAGLGPGERVKDLCAFAVSEEHFSVRAALGLDQLEATDVHEGPRL